MRNLTALLIGLMVAVTLAAAQQPPSREGPPGPFPGGAGMPERKLVKQFDQNDDGWLNSQERQAARKYLADNPQPRGPFGPGGPGGFGPRGPGNRPDGGSPRTGPNRGNNGDTSGPPGGPPGFPPPGFGPPGRHELPAVKPGKKISPKDVQPSEADLYAADTLRTLFLEFENKDWEQELADFHGTDVDVPATLTVDGKQYPGVGIHFRGMSSYGMVPAGHKRSFNVSMDFITPKQRLLGYKTLNLLNAHEDDSLLSSVLYSHIARKYIPAPKANFVRVVVNGENWGVYTNVQQFNKEMLAENYPSGQGTRWKVRGMPMGGGGLEYLGDDPSAYERHYEMKSENKAAWDDLIKLCRTLNETPADQLEKALEPMLDIDETLKFLALDIAVINCDGYWIRASDYSIFMDEQKKFHILPHDMNEAFRQPMGPGMGGPGPNRPGFGGPGSGPPGFGPPGFGPPNQSEGDAKSQNADRSKGQQNPPAGRPNPRGNEIANDKDTRPPGGMRQLSLNLDPLLGLDDSRKPLRSKLLAVPALRQRYLSYVRKIADESLNWESLGPVVASYRELISKDVKEDTRKLSTYDAFLTATSPKKVSFSVSDAQGGGPGRAQISLRGFADYRREWLMRETVSKETER
ncbi:MAG: CotH kinase family protein [Planctomycetes bacterium]|nr:CotH kinase family protein [Planctomycetota bacterium]